jgi:ABC-type cobalt transport system substrate-binding protein
MAQFLDNLAGRFDGLDLTANRRISNIEPQNYEGWFRCALSVEYLKIDRIHSFVNRQSSIVIRYSIFQSFFFDQTGRFFGRRRG